MKQSKSSSPKSDGKVEAPEQKPNVSRPRGMAPKVDDHERNRRLNNVTAIIAEHIHLASPKLMRPRKEKHSFSRPMGGILADRRAVKIIYGRKMFLPRKRTAREEIADFVALINIPQNKDSCWQWNGGLSQKGYGRFKTNGRYIGAHVVSYRLFVGTPSKGFILHSCDNPACVNPLHLFPGTMKDNTMDMILKGRHNPPRGSKHRKAKITEHDVVIIRSLIKGGMRNCDLALLYDLPDSAISFIKSRTNWKHVP